MHQHYPVYMLYSIHVGEKGSGLYQVLGSYTTHTKAQRVPYQRYHPMLSYIIGQSLISNMGAGMPSQKTKLTAASAWLVSMTLDNMDGRLYKYLILLDFYLLYIL